MTVLQEMLHDTTNLLKLKYLKKNPNKHNKSHFYIIRKNKFKMHVRQDISAKHSAFLFINQH